MLGLFMFDWDDLRYLLAVAREGSTLSASKSLGVSQPTVQRRLAALEAGIARKLVEQHPTGYRLTDLGTALVPHAEAVERSVAAFQRHATSGGSELSGTLRVTCPEGVASRLLVPMIAAFEARYPEVSVDLIMTDRRLDLAKGEADVAMRMHEPGDASLVARRIADSAWGVYASRSYLERHGRPQRYEDLDHHAVVEFTGEMAANQAAKWLRKTAPRARVAARANSMLGAMASVKSGAGLAPLPMLLGGSEVGIEAVLSPVPEIGSRVYLVTHADLRGTARVRAFSDFIAAEIKRLRPYLMGDIRTLDRPFD